MCLELTFLRLYIVKAMAHLFESSAFSVLPLSQSALLCIYENRRVSFETLYATHTAAHTRARAHTL